MVALIHHKDIPRATLDHLLQIISKDGLMDAGHNETIVTESSIGGAPGDPASRIEVELLPKLEGNVPHQSSRSQVQNTQVTTAFRDPFDDEPSFNRLPEANFIRDQYLPKARIFYNVLHETKLMHECCGSLRV
jgi:hypothetical protein